LEKLGRCSNMVFDLQFKGAIWSPNFYINLNQRESSSGF